MRNALVPVVTIAGMSFGYMFGWALIIEAVFNINGLSRALLTAIQQRDFALVQGVVMVFTFVFILANLAADIDQRLAEPTHARRPRHDPPTDRGCGGVGGFIGACLMVLLIVRRTGRAMDRAVRPAAGRYAACVVAARTQHICSAPTSPAAMC